jgi:aspartyl/asparaginyl beta-hydroxylase (cupin superfamily)
MAPNHELLPHSDGNACYASWHMGLVVPENCGVRAGGVAREHATGRWIAFDDSFTHSAWNRSASPRVVLTGWSVHPDLDDDEVAPMVEVSKLLRWGI